MVSNPRIYPASPFRAGSGTRRWVFLALLIPAAATGAEPGRSPRRYLPAKNLVAYFEFDGFDAHAEAWKKTSAYAALSKTKAGAMINDLARQAAEWLIEENVPFVKGADALALQSHLARSGITIAMHSCGADDVAVTCVFRGLGHKDLAPTLKNLKRLLKYEEPPKRTRVKGRDVYVFDDDDSRLGSSIGVEPLPLPLAKKPATDGAGSSITPWLSAWFERDDLIIVIGPMEDDGDNEVPTGARSAPQRHKDFVAIVIDTIDGKQPNVESHALYQSARKERDGLKDFEPAAFFFAGPIAVNGRNSDVAEIVGVPPAPDGQSDRPGRASSSKSIARPPRVDTEVKEASAETDMLPPVFTDKDLDFWRSDKARADLPKRVKVPEKLRRVGEGEFDFTPEQFAALGLNGVKGAIGRFGFQGDAFVTEWRIEAPAPRKGILSCIDQPMFRTADLPPIPHGVVTFAVGSLDLEKTYQHLIDAIASLDPSVGEDLLYFGKVVHDQTSVRLHDDLLKHLGPRWCVYLAPPRPGTHAPREKFDPSAWVLLAGVKDAAAFRKVLDTMAAQFNGEPGDADSERDDQRKRVDKERPGAFLDKLPTPEAGYRLASPIAEALGLDDLVRPTILVGKSFIAVAATPDLAREALAGETRIERRWKPTAKVAQALDGLPNELSFLAVADHGDSGVPAWIADLPWVTQLLLNMSEEQDLNNASARCFLDMMGLARPGVAKINIARTQIPAENDIRPFLFPSVVAATVDDHGYRLMTREAFPFAVIANETHITSWFGAEWTIEDGFRFQEQLKVTIFGVDPTTW